MVFAESMEGQNVVSRWSLFERNLASVWVTFSGADLRRIPPDSDISMFLRLLHIFAVETSCFPGPSNTLINDPMAGEDGRPSGWRKLRSQRVASQVPPLENCQGPCMENMEHLENRLHWQSAATRGIWLTVLEKWCTRTLGEDIRDKILSVYQRKPSIWSST